MTNAFWDRIRWKTFLTPGDDLLSLETFYILDVAIPCKDIEWYGLGDSPHADQIAKFIDILTMGLEKKSYEFLKLMKIKRVIINLCH